MFKPVSSRVSFPEMDARILDFWKQEDIFRRSESERADGPLFMLFEGPPTANGSPGIHHVLARVFKDVICRHRTMKGYRCLRKGGWDTHGLPVELEIEKELGLTSKREIEEYGIEKFNAQCRDSVFRYVKDWEVLTDRIGFWVDMDDPYVTLENGYIESCWWIIKQLWDKGLVYQGLRGTPHCPRCETSLSSHEVALGYKDDTPDPSVFPKFQVNTWTDGSIPEVPTFLLAWTTTPWTLPGNTALAVDASAEYSIVQMEGPSGPERLIVASALVGQAISGEHTVVGSVAGRDLVGFTYQPLYDPFQYGAAVRRFTEQVGEDGGTATVLEPASEFQPRVVDADFVSMEDGTGIVHIAPAFGDEDLNLGRSRLLSFVQEVDLSGNVTGSYPFAGKFVKDADPLIIADLEERGLLHHKGDLSPHLPLLLALRHPPPLLRQVLLVHPHHRRQGPPRQRQRRHQLVPRLHQGRPLRRMAPQQHRLGHLPRALLGHPHSHLGMSRLPPPDLHRQRRRAGRTRLRRQPVFRDWS